jgi:hypothetical protein
MKNIFPFVLILIIFFCSCARDNDITLSPGFTIYLTDTTSAPIKKALEILQRDLESVLGEKSPVQLLAKNDQATNALIIFNNESAESFWGTKVQGFERHKVYTQNGNIILHGADELGTIFAIYTFSEKLLGIKPLWLWASIQPDPKEHIGISPAYEFDSGEPYVKYRAWFPNDRDFLIPWQQLSDENYEAFFETMLRLKLNTLEGTMTDQQSFTPPYLPGKEANVAREHGLFVTGHHMSIFGSSYNFWNDYWQNVRNQSPPEISIANRQNLRDWWAFHIDLGLRNNIDVIWLVGFRGNRDIPFWLFFPDAPENEHDRAKVIEEMVQMQIDLLKEKTQNENPLMRLTLYNEMSTLVGKNLFQVPKNDSLILTFVAARRDHFPPLDLRTFSFTDELVGYYMNFQFTSTGSHLAQAEGLRKMEQNFRIVDSLSGGNLIFSVVNAGNIREHVLELSANADMMWNFDTFCSGSFLDKFCNMYFGNRFGEEIAVLYQDFFNSYWQQKKGDIQNFERQYLFQDMRYGRTAEMLLSDLEEGKYNENPLEGHPLDNPDTGSVGYFRVVPADNGVENQIDAILKGTATSIAKLEQVIEKADKIYPKLKTGQHFFDDNLRGQAYLMLHLNKMLNYLTKAYQETGNILQRKHFLQQSINEIQLAQQRLNKAEHGIFADWYAHDRVFGIANIENRLKNLLAQIDE